ncbi:MAG: hypothetical protein QXH61_06435 [Candidatus Nezhaarchaeales archaeon]
MQPSLTAFFKRERLVAEQLCLLFAGRLHGALKEFLEKNEKALNPKLVEAFRKHLPKIKSANNPVDVMAYALWVFNMTVNFAGVMAGITSEGPTYPDGEEKAIPENLDKQSTKRLLVAISAALNAQYIPREWFK